MEKQKEAVWVSVKSMKLDIYFSEFTCTVFYNDDNGTISVLRAYSNEGSKRIMVTTEMFEQIEDAVRGVIRGVSN